MAPKSTAKAIEPTPSRGRGSSYNVKEDEHLCNTILSISHDPITGVNQEGRVYWERITSAFNSSKDPWIAHRPRKSLENRFGTIKHDTKKYMGCVSQVRRLQQSGTNAKDEEQAALALYKEQPSNEGKDFKFMHCWNILKDAPE
jgi:hypothetical protein